MPISRDPPACMAAQPDRGHSPLSQHLDCSSDFDQDLSELDISEAKTPFGRPGSLKFEAGHEDHRAALVDDLELQTTNSEGCAEGGADHKEIENDNGCNNLPSSKHSSTPAQNRRKAQNRAAQRAFRERKEQHVRELERRLSFLEATSNTLRTDNARLKFALHRATAENDILRARSHILATQASPADTPLGSPTLPFQDVLSAPPFEFVPQANASDFDFFSIQRPRPASLPNGERLVAAGMFDTGLHGDFLDHPLPIINLQAPPSTMAERQNVIPRSARMLSAQETWDYIHATPHYQRGLVDLAHIIAKLKTVARERAILGEPAFEEGDIIKAIEEASQDCNLYANSSDPSAVRHSPEHGSKLTQES